MFDGTSRDCAESAAKYLELGPGEEKIKKRTL